MQILPLLYPVLPFVFLFIVAIIPYFALGYARRKTNQFRKNFEKGRFALDPEMKPGIVNLYGTIISSRVRWVSFNLFALLYMLVVPNLLAIVVFNLAIDFLLAQSFLFLVIFLESAIRTEIDETGGLGELWHKESKKL